MRKLLAALFFISVPAYCSSLTPIEAKIVETVKLEQQDQLHFLEKLVNIQSGTLNTSGVRAVGNLVKIELEKLGFKTSWADEPASMHRAGSLIAIHKGDQGKRLLLIGHLDTVFLKEAPFKKYSQSGQTGKGQGVADDKGGVVVMLYALKALQKSGDLQHANITIVLTGDEEESGKPVSISRKPLLMAAKNVDVALDFEPSITKETVTIARRGISNWTLTVHGNAAHSATIFHQRVGMGAIFGAAHILNDMRTNLQDTPNLSFNPGLILGGTSVTLHPESASGTAAGKENVVASTAIVKGDLRFIDHQQKEAAKQKIRDMTAASMPGVKASIEFVDGIPAMSPTENSAKLLEQYSQASIDLGQGEITPLPASARGAGDISYVAGMVNASLSGLGPLGEGEHTAIESLELNSLPMQTERAALLMSRLVTPH